MSLGQRSSASDVSTRSQHLKRNLVTWIRTGPVVLDQQQAGTEQALMEEAIRLTFAGLKGSQQIATKAGSAQQTVGGSLKSAGRMGPLYP